jgi:hypothetical protein
MLPVGEQKRISSNPCLPRRSLRTDPTVAISIVKKSSAPVTETVGYPAKRGVVAAGIYQLRRLGVRSASVLSGDALRGRPISAKRAVLAAYLLRH